MMARLLGRPLPSARIPPTQSEEPELVRPRLKSLSATENWLPLKENEIFGAEEQGYV